MRERYSFRFTSFEIAYMRRILEQHRHIRPSQVEMQELALSFSKARQQQGLTCVRLESIQSWYKRNRHGYTRAGRGRPHVESTKLMNSSLSAQPTAFENQNHAVDEDTSGKSSSEEESLEEVMSESTNSDEARSERNIQYNDESTSADSKDVSLQPVVHLQGSVSDVEHVVARLARYKRVQSDIGSKMIISKCTDSSPLSVVGQAKSTLEKLKGLSLVDFRIYEVDIKSAIQIILDESGLLSDKEKAELSLLPVKLHSIAQENERVRKDLADCGAFMEKLQECEENTVKLMEKAKVWEEKYNAFPQSMPTLPNKGDEVECVSHLEKAEAEKMKGDKEYVVAELARLGEYLLSASTHYKILKAEEAAVVEKRIKNMECLQKNTEEWVKHTNSRNFTFI